MGRYDRVIRSRSSWPQMDCSRQRHCRASSVESTAGAGMTFLTAR